MKAKPYREDSGGYKPCAPEDATHVALEMPGPLAQRLMPVILHGARRDYGRQPVWSWNGDTEKPTLKPSILTKGVMPLTDEQRARHMKGGPLPPPVGIICHAWVNDGQVQFLADCTHELAGQTVPLLDVTWI